MIPDGGCGVMVVVDWVVVGGGGGGGGGYITTKLTTKHTCNVFLEHLTMEIYAMNPDQAAL